jgi:hypothetical protein
MCRIVSSFFTCAVLLLTGLLDTDEVELSQQWVDEQTFSYGMSPCSLLFTNLIRPSAPTPPELPISVRRVLTGAEQTHGGLLLSIANTGDTTHTTAWLETMPWFIQFFLHTLELRVDGQRRGMSDSLRKPLYINLDIPLQMTYSGT